jgi:hypothetical protein
VIANAIMIAHAMLRQWDRALTHFEGPPSAYCPLEAHVPLEAHCAP